MTLTIRLKPYPDTNPRARVQLNNSRLSVPSSLHPLREYKNVSIWIAQFKLQLAIGHGTRRTPDGYFVLDSLIESTGIAYTNVGVPHSAGALLIKVWILVIRYA